MSVKTLYKYLKESLLDMEDVEDSTLKTHALKELLLNFLQYDCKIVNQTPNSFGIIFDKKYNHKQWDKIVNDFESELNELDIKFLRDKFETQQGSLKLYCNDFEFKFETMTIYADFTYQYRMAISRDSNYMDTPNLIPEHGSISFNIQGKAGREFIKILKKELIK